MALVAELARPAGPSFVLAGVTVDRPATLPEMVKRAARARRRAVDRAWRDPRGD